jgi:DNA-binding NarL/FixJ family response regulator
MKRTIYFDTLRGQFSIDAITAISDITHSTIDVVDSWPALMSLLCQELCHEEPSGDDITVVIFNKDALSFPGTTVNEIVDALTTISTIAGPKKVSVGILVNDKCEQKFVQHLKKSNISGIVPHYKSFGDADFFDALNVLLAGSTHWPDAYIVPKVKSSTRATVEYGIRLTGRQREIMALVANRGLSNKKIAQILNISESTVKVHISSILKAYGVRNRTQLALAGNKGLHA